MIIIIIIIVVVVVVVIVVVVIHLALSSGCSHFDMHPKGASHNK